MGVGGVELSQVGQALRLPDLTPLYSERQLAEELCVAILSDLAFAAARGTLLLLEPLIRYEVWYVRRLPTATGCSREPATPTSPRGSASAGPTHTSVTPSWPS